MKLKALLTVSCLALAACGPKQSETTETPAGPTADAPVVAAEAAAPTGTSGPAFKEPLAGGITALPFQYTITSEKSPLSKDGQLSRVVALEFTEGDVPTIDQRLADAFQTAGYERKLPGVKDGATRSIYTKAGDSDVLVWVRPDVPPGPQFKPMSPEGKGTIYLAWKVK